MPRVLLVEDDESLGRTLTERLEKEHLEVSWVQTIAAAEAALGGDPWDLAILDVKLPDGSGFGLARHIKRTSLVPLMFMTALNSAENRLEGFEIGADEYLPKPFHLKEFILRVRHVLTTQRVPEEVRAQGRLIDLRALSVVGPDGERTFLQVRDGRVLRLLIAATPAVVDRSEILDRVWGRDQFPTPRAVDNAIVRLRQALQDDRGQFIRSVRGVGYQWAPDPRHTMNNRFSDALEGRAQTVPPIWCMRQAGRYQRAYQALRRRHSFEELCRDPELAAKVALASIEDFDFDAAILFSDLLFPLDALGLGVEYDDHGPHLKRRFTKEFRKRLRPMDKVIDDLAFQAEAVAATRRQLPASKGLIGFIGGPWTLFVYAVEGTHTGSLAQAKSSLALYHDFAKVIVPVLERVAAAQLKAGADLVMVFDTAAGELTPTTFRRQIVPDLNRLADKFPGRLGYFARGLHPAHLDRGALSPSWAGLGVDWRWHLADVLQSPDRRGFLQGNFDPALLKLTGSALRGAIDEFLAPISRLIPDARRGWICGLGHGVLPGTPEASVRTFVRMVRKRLT